MTGASAGATTLEGAGVVFRLEDPEHRFASVRLDAGLGTAGVRPELSWAEGIWSVTLDLPPLARVEYGFEVTRTVPDAGELIDSGVGPRSVLELPGYERPAWLGRPEPQGTTRDVTTGLAGLTAQIWAPAGLPPYEPAPLLLVQDGQDYAARGSLTHYLGLLIADGVVPPLRALLTSAHPRELRYAADETYADDVAAVLLPGVDARWRTTAVVGMGASLGALTTMLIAARHPGLLRGVFLQSGSFFTTATDSQESWFSRFPLIADTTAWIGTPEVVAGLPPVAITCGAHEENALNNRLLVSRLRRRGADVAYSETPDLHNMTSWRDSYDPLLRDLLAAALS